jgi:hypothetical protein
MQTVGTTLLPRNISALGQMTQNLESRLEVRGYGRSRRVHIENREIKGTIKAVVYMEH